jgi:hypothetical protein
MRPVNFTLKHAHSSKHNDDAPRLFYLLKGRYKTEHRINKSLVVLALFGLKVQA